jgi:hypothetical protein
MLSAVNIRSGLDSELNPRKTLEELELTGSPNILRSKKRMAAEREKAPLAPGTQAEIAQIDELIQVALAGCRHGQTFRKKRNPAFANLELLIKARKLLTEKGPVAREKTGAEVLAESLAIFTPSSKKETN